MDHANTELTAQIGRLSINDALRKPMGDQRRVEVAMGARPEKMAASNRLRIDGGRSTDNSNVLVPTAASASLEEKGLGNFMMRGNPDYFLMQVKTLLFCLISIFDLI